MSMAVGKAVGKTFDKMVGMVVDKAEDRAVGKVVDRVDNCHTPAECISCHTHLLEADTDLAFDQESHKDSRSRCIQLQA